MSQYNARLICGSGLSQSGDENFCSAHKDAANVNAQILLENPNPGDQPFDSVGLCLKNSRLAYTLYDYAKAPKGIAGFKRYLSWVKAQVIAGNQVTIGVQEFDGTDPQYDHEVSVSKIGTNHGKDDPSYYDDDVLYFDDHALAKSYTDGFTFKSLSKSRSEAGESQVYTILVPGAYPIYATSGGDGVNNNPNPITASNFAFSVSGPFDTQKNTLPVRLTIASSSVHGVPNLQNDYSEFNFEAPALESSCTNRAPSTWMELKLNVEVSALTPGTTYKLYEYDFNEISGIGSEAALAVPESDFNANARMASKVTQFTASSDRYSQTIETTSDKIVVFRCVAASAP